MDYATEHTQRAPLSHDMALPSSGKRLVWHDYSSANVKRKKRKSLLNDTAASTVNQVMPEQESNAKMPTVVPHTSNKKAFTICFLCDLHFKTELELEEHLYSLLHHRALDTEKGKNFAHECNLCRVKRKGLSSYVNHLREEVHRKNLEKRKDDHEHGRLSGPVNKLNSYQSSFMCKPKHSLLLKDNTQKQMLSASARWEDNRPVPVTSTSIFDRNNPASVEKLPFSTQDHLRYSQGLYAQPQQQHADWNSPLASNHISDSTPDRNNDRFSWSKKGSHPRAFKYHQRGASVPGRPYRSWDTKLPSHRQNYRSGRDPVDQPWLTDYNGSPEPLMKTWSPRGKMPNPARGVGGKRFLYRGNGRSMPGRRIDARSRKNHKQSPYPSPRLKASLLKPQLSPNNSNSALNKFKHIQHENKICKITANRPPYDEKAMGKYATNEHLAASNGRSPLHLQDLSKSSVSVGDSSSLKTSKTKQEMKSLNGERKIHKPGETENAGSVKLPASSRAVSCNSSRSSSTCLLCNNGQKNNLGASKVGSQPKGIRSKPSRPEFKGISTRNSTLVPGRGDLTPTNSCHSARDVELHKDVPSSRSTLSALSTNSFLDSRFSFAVGSHVSSAISHDSSDSNLIRKKFRAIMDELQPPSHTTSTDSLASAMFTQPRVILEKIDIKSESDSTTFSTKQLKPRKVLVTSDDAKEILRGHDSVNSESEHLGRSCDSEVTETSQAVTNTSSKSDLTPRQAAAKVWSSSSKSNKDNPGYVDDSKHGNTDSVADPEKSAATVRQELLALVKRKQEELAQNKNESAAPPSQVGSDVTTTTSSQPRARQIKQEKPEIKGEQLQGAESNAGDHSKRKDAPKPNIRKARSRLVVRERCQSTSDSENDKKQARIANLMLKVGGRPVPNLAAAKSPQKKLNLPRFGIGLAPNDADQPCLSLDDIDLQELISSIQQAELLHENEPSSKRVRSLSEGESAKMNVEKDSKQASNPPASRDENPSPTHLNSSSSSKSEKFSARLLEMSEREELLHAQSKDVKERAEKLREEIAHVDNLVEQLVARKTELDEEAVKVDQADEKIHHDLEQIRQNRLLMLRDTVASNNLPSSTCDASEPIPFRPDSCTHSTPTPTSRVDPANISSWTSPAMISNLTPPKFMNPQANFNESSSYPSNETSRYDTAMTGTNFDTTGNFSRDTEKSQPTSSLVKPESREPSHIHRDDVTNQRSVRANVSTEPFPVATGSAYFHAEANQFRSEASGRRKPNTSSIDGILRKYLKDASSEREVTSSTMANRKDSTSSRIQKFQDTSADSEVSSTTHQSNNRTERLRGVNNSASSGASYGNEKAVDFQRNLVRTRPETDGNFRPKKRKKRLPQDPHLAALELQQPAACEATMSWVTAHDGTINATSSGASSTKLTTPVTLTAKETELALLHAKSLSIHTGSVMCVHVTEYDVMITCSKDKSVHVTDLSTGGLINSYQLENVPVTAHLVPERTNDSSKHSTKAFSLLVVFIDDFTERNMLTESTVHRLSIKMNISHRLSKVSCRFEITKLLDYSSCILCIHIHNDLLYFGARDGRVAIFDQKKLEIENILDCHSPHAICCLTTGTDGARRVICCGSSDCRVSVRDAVDGLLLRILSGHTKTVNCLQLVNNLLYSGSSDRSVLVHDIHNGDVVHRFLGLHAGSVKALSVQNSSLISLCLDKKVRVLRTEQPAVYGMPKSVSSLPLNMHVRYCNVIGERCRSGLYVPLVCIGCVDGKIEIFPLPQLAHSSDRMNTVNADIALPNDSETHPKTSTAHSCDVVIDLVDGLHCLWNDCKAEGFTNGSALRTHIGLFHTTDNYMESLNSCCLWGDCTHYFSSDLDSALDVRLHMEKHVKNLIKASKKP